MRKIIVSIIAVLPILLVAQTKDYSYSTQNSFDYEISIGSGFGSYWMPSLSDLQNTIIAKSDIPLFKTTSFPAYFNYSFKFGKKRDVGYSGMMGGVMSTGARSSVADYSGYYFSDINCSAAHFGYYSRQFFGKSKLLKFPVEIGYLLNCSALFSSVTCNENLQLYGINEAIVDESNTFVSLGVYTEPMIFATCMFTKNIGIELSGGAALSVSRPLFYGDIRNSVSMYDKSRFANWSGYRLGISLISIL